MKLDKKHLMERKVALIKVEISQLKHKMNQLKLKYKKVQKDYWNKVDNKIKRR